MANINKAIPPSNLEFPEFVQQDYPKCIGHYADGTMIRAESEAHEQQLRDEFPEETQKHDDKLLEDSEKPLKYHQEQMRSKHRPGAAPRPVAEAAPAAAPKLASETHGEDDPFAKDEDDKKKPTHKKK